MKTYTLKKTPNFDQAEFISLEDLYEALKSRSEVELPPFEIFETQYDESWFAKAFSVEIVAGEETPAIDALEKVQEDYIATLHRTKSLKAQRSTLIRLALEEDEDVEDIIDASGQSISEVSALTTDKVSEATLHKIEEIEAETKAKNRRLTVLRKGAQNDEEAAWLNDYRQLKTWRKQRTESKKNHNGDAWFGCDFTEEEFDDLVKKVENGFSGVY